MKLMQRNNFNSSIRLAFGLSDILFPNSTKFSSITSSSKYEIDFYRSIVPYLYLYRLPALLNSKNYSFKSIILSKLRIVNGVIRFLFKSKKLSILKIKDGENNNSRILFYGVNENFYAQVLNPVVWLLTNKNYCVYKLIVCNNINSRKFRSIISNFKIKSLILMKGIYLYNNTNWLRVKELLIKENLKCNISLLKDEIKWCLLSDIPRLVFEINDLDQDLIKHKIELFISADDCDQSSRTVNLLTKEMGIKTLVVQQGITNKEYPDWNDVTAQHIACMSNSMAEIIMSQGVDGDSIKVVGNPCFDHYINCYLKKFTRDATIAYTKKITQNKILFASQPYVQGAFASCEKRYEMIKIFLDASSELNNFTFIYKIHPVERRNDIIKLLSQYSKVILAESDSNLSKLICECDIFVTMFSQTTLDAIIAKKPVINIHTDDCGCTDIFSSSNSTFVARSKDELIDLLIHISRYDWKISEQMSNARDEIIEKLTFKADGKSSERVCEYIDQLLINMN